MDVELVPQSLHAPPFGGDLQSYDELVSLGFPIAHVHLDELEDVAGLFLDVAVGGHNHGLLDGLAAPGQHVGDGDLPPEQALGVFVEVLGGPVLDVGLGRRLPQGEGGKDAAGTGHHVPVVTAVLELGAGTEVLGLRDNRQRDNSPSARVSRDLILTQISYLPAYQIIVPLTSKHMHLISGNCFCKKKKMSSIWINVIRPWRSVVARGAGQVLFILLEM